MMSHWSDVLRRRGACDDAITWCKQFDCPNKAWKALTSYDWLDWILWKTGYDKTIGICMISCNKREQKYLAEFCDKPHPTLEEVKDLLPDFPL